MDFPVSRVFPSPMVSILSLILSIRDVKQAKEHAHDGGAIVGPKHKCGRHCSVTSFLFRRLEDCDVRDRRGLEWDRNDRIAIGEGFPGAWKDMFKRQKAYADDINQQAPLAMSELFVKLIIKEVCVPEGTHTDAGGSLWLERWGLLITMKRTLTVPPGALLGIMKKGWIR